MIKVGNLKLIEKEFWEEKRYSLLNGNTLKDKIMINIEELTNKDIQRKVVYTDGVGEREEGHITSWNGTYIFVDYGKSCGRGIATIPIDLQFMIG
jgi:hypothetical protein